jgi:hypothetical protein
MVKLPLRIISRKWKIDWAKFAKLMSLIDSTNAISEQETAHIEKKNRPRYSK